MNKENAVLSRTKMLFRRGMENMVWMATTRTISYGANLYVDGLQMYYVMHVPLQLEGLWPYVMMLLLHKSLSHFFHSVFLLQRCRKYAVATRLFLIDIYKVDNLLKLIISVSTWKETISGESLKLREGASWGHIGMSFLANSNGLIGIMKSLLTEHANADSTTALHNQQLTHINIILPLNLHWRE